MNPGLLTAKPWELSSAPQVPLPCGPHTSVSEQRWAGLQVSLLPEHRAVSLYVQIKEALPPPPRASSMFVINIPIRAAKPWASGGPKVKSTRPWRGRRKLGADRHRFVLNPCLTARRWRLKFQPLHYSSPVQHIFQPRNTARQKT